MQQEHYSNEDKILNMIKTKQREKIKMKRKGYTRKRRENSQ